MGAKTRENFAIDSVAFAGLVLLSSSGVVMHYLLPPGSGRFRTLWGLDRHQWGAIHFWVAVVFLIVLAIHLLLHWRWILSVIRGRVKKYSGMRARAAVFAVLCFLALALAPLFSPVKEEKRSRDSLKGSAPGAYEEQTPAVHARQMHIR